MKARWLAPLRCRLGCALVALPLCFSQALWADDWQKLAEIPVIRGVGRRASTAGARRSQASLLNEHWPVIKLRQIDGGQYAGRAELKIGPDATEPLGVRISPTGAIGGTFSCNVSPARSVPPGGTVTVSAKRTGSDISGSAEDWDNVQVATVFVDAGPWRVEVPVIMDVGDKADATDSDEPKIKLRRIGLGIYEGCTDVKIETDPSTTVGCKITPTRIYSGKYSCWFRPTDFETPGGTATVGARLEDLDLRGQPGSLKEEKVATVSLQAECWQADIPVVMKAGAGVAFVRHRDELRLQLSRTGLHSHEGCLEVLLETHADLTLKCEIVPTGAAGGTYSCSVSPARVATPGRTTTICAKLQAPQLRGSRDTSNEVAIANVSLYGKPRQPRAGGE